MNPIAPTALADRIPPPLSLDTDVRSYIQHERVFSKRERRDRLAKLLASSGYSALSAKVSACNSEFFALACRNGHVAQRLPVSRCRNRLCPFCAGERQQRAHAKLRLIVSQCLNTKPRTGLVLITLTFRHSSDSLRSIDKDFKSAFNKLRRMQAWRKRIAGGVCGYEFNLTTTGWHYHAHVLAICNEWYDQAALTEDWRMATRGRGMVTDIRCVSREGRGLSKTLRYCFKSPRIEGWTANEVRQFQAMRRVKLAETFGVLRGVTVAGDDEELGSISNKTLFVGHPCPSCGEPLAKLRLTWSEVRFWETTARSWPHGSRAGPVSPGVKEKALRRPLILPLLNEKRGNCGAL